MASLETIQRKLCLQRAGIIFWREKIKGWTLKVVYSSKKKYKFYSRKAYQVDWEWIEICLSYVSVLLLWESS